MTSLISLMVDASRPPHSHAADIPAAPLIGPTGERFSGGTCAGVVAP